MMDPDMKNSVIELVLAELDRAMEMHPPMSSPHEAFGIIKEELDEFWDEVKQTHHNKMELGKQAKQIAAMAIRAIHDLDLPTC